MFKELRDQHLYLIYGDIVVGFSVLKTDDQDFFVKHLNIFDLIVLEKSNTKFKKEGASKGFLSEAEKLSKLNQTKEWKNEDEKEYQNDKIEIKNLEKHLEKVFLQSQRKEFEKELLKKEQKHTKEEETRRSLLGFTLENFLEKRSNEESIRISLYTNEKLTELAFNKQEFEELDDDFFISVVNKYNQAMQDFSDLNVKKIAASGFFLNPFFLSKDDCFAFFGKRIIELTFFQQNLFSKGILYKSILSQDKKPPESYHSDIDKMVGWFDSMSHDDSDGKNQTKNKNLKKSSKNKLTGVVGATKEEIEEMAIKEGGRAINLGQEMEKYRKELKKDKLDTEDIINLHERLGV